MLLEEIARDIKHTAYLTGVSKLSQKVYESIQKTPRQDFVQNEDKKRAYRNRPLPIGFGQTISQPYIVALMTELLQTQKHHTVLEVGTGSGYQAAVLSTLVKQVYTLEIIKKLGELTVPKLKEYKNVKAYTNKDGWYGLKEKAPFDGIIVTAASNEIPPDLIKQLKVGGRMVIPVGQPFQTQKLIVLYKKSEKKVEVKDVLAVSFVPFTRK